MMSDINKLHAELKKLEQRDKQRQQQAEADNKARQTLKLEIYKVALRTALGIPGVVEIGDSIFRPCHPAVRGKRGTLVNVNRTRCTIEIDGEQWDVHVKDAHITGEPHFSIACKAAGLTPDGKVPNA